MNTSLTNMLILALTAITSLAIADLCNHPKLMQERLDRIKSWYKAMGVAESLIVHAAIVAGVCGLWEVVA